MSDAKSGSAPHFVQLLVFTDCADASLLVSPIERLGLPATLYKDLNDPQGVGLLTVADDPSQLVDNLRDLLGNRIFRVLMQRHELTMIGRTFGGAGKPGTNPGEVITNDQWPWIVWHPIRATAGLVALDEADQLASLDALIAAGGADPGAVGHVRLKSHGLDRRGNEFVHGLHGRDLAEISSFIETMKRAAEHGTHIASAGPYFAGRAVHGAEDKAAAGARW